MGAGINALSAFNRSLCAQAEKRISARFGTEPLLPREMRGSMALVALPAPRAGSYTSTSAKVLQDWLHEERGIECPVKCVEGELFARISAHAYNELCKNTIMCLLIQKKFRRRREK